MTEDFRKTLFKIIHLRSIIGYNGLVFALKQTPVIGKIIPYRLYGTTFLKVIYWIFHVIKEIFVLFIGKIFGLGMIYLITLFLKTEYMDFDMAAGIPEATVYAGLALFFFLVYALCGVLINTSLFRCTTEKEYLVFMLRMNARKLNNTLLVYELGKLFIGYLIAGIVALLGGAPFWIWLGIPVLAVFIKLFGAGFQAFVFRIKHKHHKKMHNSAFSLVVRLLVAILMIPVLFIVAINGYYVPLKILLTVSFALILLGVWGFFELKRFDPNLHRRALNDNIVREEIEHSKAPDTNKEFKQIKAKGSIKSDKKGFEYLNELFVKRHWKMLNLKPVVFAFCVLFFIAFIIVQYVLSYKEQFGTDNTVNMVFSNILNMLMFKGYEDALLPLGEHSPLFFFRYLAESHMLGMIVLVSAADVSFKATQAMYINCDNSLMTFSFFKQREKIIRLFDIRLKQLVKLNVVPALVLGIAADLILFYTGGQSYPFHYLVTLFIPVLLCVVNSVTSLALYYLFQPFTTTVNVKSGAYLTARTLLGLFEVQIFWVPANSLLLAGILTVFTVIYVMLLRALVRKFAPKTWKVRV
ncbi:MAG: hypothetical protein K5665_07090 [Saccharofermentans sp.]|nr:hypothetical protein [Saccharofermentans sp.]